MEFQDDKPLLIRLENALNKQIFDLRALLSSLAEEEQNFHEENKALIEEILENRLNLLEVYENAEAKSISLMELYLLNQKKPSLLRRALKVEQLNDFKSALSIVDFGLSFQVDQLISLLNKIQETNQTLRMLDQNGTSRPPLLIIEESTKKKIKAQIGLIN